MAHSPHAKDCRRFLRIPRGTVVPVILPLWQQEEPLDLRQVVFTGMSKKRVCSRHLLHMD